MIQSITIGPNPHHNKYIKMHPYQMLYPLLLFCCIVSERIFIILLLKLLDSEKFMVGCYCLQRRQWHPTPVFLPGKSHGWRSLVGCSPWGHQESDTTERLHFHFTSMWEECNCAVVWAFFSITFLWDWNENRPFPVLATAEFSKFVGILSAALSQHHLSGFEIAQLEFHHLH